jgi:4-hydroxybenzoate polyprenyltransferase
MSIYTIPQITIQTMPNFRPDLLRWLDTAANFGLVMPLGAASAVSVVPLVATGKVSLPLALATFLCVYSSYLIDHLSDVGRMDAGLASSRTKTLARLSLFRGLGLCAYLLSMWLTLSCAGPEAAMILLCFPLSVSLYATPLFGRLTHGLFGYRRLKDIPGFKSFYTAFFWGLLMVYAAVFVGNTEPRIVAFFFTYMLLSDFINTVFCDYKDLERDRAEGLLTWVSMLGLARSTRLLKQINLATLGMLALVVAAHWMPNWLLALAPVHLYVRNVIDQGHITTMAGGNPGDALMDAEFVLWLPLALLGMSIGQ